MQGLGLLLRRDVEQRRHCLRHRVFFKPLLDLVELSLVSGLARFGGGIVGRMLVRYVMPFVRLGMRRPHADPPASSSVRWANTWAVGRCLSRQVSPRGSWRGGSGAGGSR